MSEIVGMIPIHSLSVAASVDRSAIEHQGEDEAPKTGLQYLFSIAAMCLAVGSFGFQIAAIVITLGPFMYIAGGLGMVIAAAVGVRQITIAKMDTLRDIHNKLRDEVNRMTGENNLLHNNVDELETEVHRVEKIEGELTIIAERGNMNANKLVDLVKQNAETLKRQTKCVKASVAEQVLTSILRTDRDSSLTITENEVNRLCLRLKHLDGIKIDEAQLRSILKTNDGSVGSVMQFLRSMDPDSDETDDIGIKVDLQSRRSIYTDL